MARPKPTTFDKQRVAADNRRAKFDYHIEDTYEAGLALQGTEVKALLGGFSASSVSLVSRFLLVPLLGAGLEAEDLCRSEPGLGAEVLCR